MGVGRKMLYFSDEVGRKREWWFIYLFSGASFIPLPNVDGEGSLGSGSPLVYWVGGKKRRKWR